MVFFTNFVDKCNKIGKSPSAVAEEMGYQRSVITRWSKGTAPRQATLQKVAAYFGCTVSELTGEKEKPTPEGEPNKAALLKVVDTMTREELIQMLNKISQRLTEV